MNHQIPGFYYNEEKKKYFKIQPNYAVPAGSAYSAGGAKRQKVELEAATLRARIAEQRKGHIRRARILQDPLLGGSLSREYGYDFPLDGAARVFVHGLDGAEILQCERRPAILDQRSTPPRASSPLHSSDYNPLHNHRPKSRGPLGCNSSTIAMGAFDFHPVTRSLFYPKGGEMLCEIVESKHDLQESKPYNPLFRREDSVILAASRSPISSITIEPKTNLMLTTWRGPNAGHNMHVVRACQAAWDESGPSIISRIEHHAGRSPTLWSATHGAPGSPFIFAIAAEDSVITIDQHSSLTASMCPSIATKERPSAIVAVECLSQHPTVVLGGMRNGKVIFLDVRLRAREYQSDTESIRHPSTVSKIKQLSEHIIVVAGLNSTLCNYDLRFIQQRPRHKAWSNWDWTRRPMPEVIQTEVSEPVLVYPEHSNGPYIDLGFDVNPEAGIVAAVQDDDFYSLKIFSSKTGRVLRALEDTFTKPAFDMATVKAVKFVQDEDDGRMKSLWVAKGTKIVRYGW